MVDSTPMSNPACAVLQCIALIRIYCLWIRDWSESANIWYTFMILFLRAATTIRGQCLQLKFINHFLMTAVTCKSRTHDMMAVCLCRLDNLKLYVKLRSRALRIEYPSSKTRIVAPPSAIEQYQRWGGSTCSQKSEFKFERD